MQQNFFKLFIKAPWWWSWLKWLRGKMGIEPLIERFISSFRMSPLAFCPSSFIKNNLVKDSNINWRRQWHPTPVLLPGKPHGWRSLVGCSPWDRQESETTEQLHFHFSLSCIGEGNGNPLQCSCLENPRDRGAWWAAIYGVAQSRTGLKWLSSLAASF